MCNKGGVFQTGARILKRKPLLYPKSSASQEIIQRVFCSKVPQRNTVTLNWWVFLWVLDGFTLYLKACADASWQAASLPFPDVTGMKSYASQIRTSYQKAWGFAQVLLKDDERSWKLSSCNWSVGQYKQSKRKRGVVTLAFKRWFVNVLCISYLPLLLVASSSGAFGCGGTTTCQMVMLSDSLLLLATSCLLALLQTSHWGPKTHGWGNSGS